ncbi:DMT family transporter [Nocardiopsis lambiniae]|uniref:DMT family transporter n=1 Tax=Nocardiopsis lambiniae TaxID=3075539 RepID=A0ABU2MCP0_9ACTN|nr:DMT family transporter [Nocardiopsis sp. DSM 44743]MDT0330443.1 DMT family transporter [Nocardiopsis sp. DSM 44743]
MSVLSPPEASPVDTRRPLADWRVKFALLALIWGMSFVFIKVAAESLAPTQVSLGRIVAGALPLLVVMLLRGGRWPASPRLWAHMAVAALLLNTIPFTLFGYAGQLIPSAVMGIVNAATPLFGVAFSMVLLADERRPDRDRVLGLAVGFLGVLVVFGVWNSLGEVSVSDRDAMIGMAFVVAATACYGIGTPYLRRFVAGSSHSALELSTLQLLLAAVPLAVLVPLTTDVPTGVTWQVVASVVVLGVLGTGVAYILQYSVVREAGATVATTVTYVVPVISIAAGITLMGESLSWNQPLGAVVIIVGAALCQGMIRTRPVRPPSA